MDGENTFVGRKVYVNSVGIERADFRVAPMLGKAVDMIGKVECQALGNFPFISCNF